MATASPETLSKALDILHALERRGRQQDSTSSRPRDLLQLLGFNGPEIQEHLRAYRYLTQRKAIAVVELPGGGYLLTQVQGRFDQVMRELRAEVDTPKQQLESHLDELSGIRYELEAGPTAQEAEALVARALVVITAAIGAIDKSG